MRPRDFLVLAQERLETYRTARLKFAAGKIRAERVTKAFASYGTVTTTALEKIYKGRRDRVHELLQQDQ